MQQVPLQKAKESFDVFAKETRHHLPKVGPSLTGTAKPFFLLSFSMGGGPGKVIALVLLHRHHSAPTPPAPPFFSAASSGTHHRYRSAVCIPEF